VFEGEELSIFVVTDGERYKVLNSAQDHKRIFDDDKGPNTGGMGAYCPTPLFEDKLRDKVEQRIIIPTIEGMKKEGHPYKGFLYVGIMVVDGEPYVIEYNARLGDPEAQVIIPMIQGNLFPIIKHVINDSLDSINIENNDGFAVTVILVSKGYPDEYKKGMKIQGLDDNLMIFHSGTKIMNDKYYTNGGRVLCV
jgi:phosphoribosylamine--glycine ligase